MLEPQMFIVLEPQMFIVTAEVGARGTLTVNGFKLHSVDEFFSSPPSRYFNALVPSRIYTLTLNTQEPLQLLTKKRLREEFSEYEDTDMYHYLN